MCAPRKLLEAQQFNRKYHRYEDIDNVPDRLRWCRHSRGMMQVEVAAIAGVSRASYIDIECGITQHIPASMMEKLADFYGVPITDFMDEFNRFLYDGQANRIRAYRKSMRLGKKPFARATGIPIRCLLEWEAERKQISQKSWEKYFMGKA